VKKKIFFLAASTFLLFFSSTLAGAEECDNPGGLTDTVKIGQCIGKYSGVLDAISKANTTNARELASLNAQISNLKVQIGSLEKQLEKLGGQIFEREVKIGVKNELMAAKIRQDYIRKREQSMLVTLLASQTAQKFFQDIAYREKLAGMDRETIGQISSEVVELRGQSEKLRVNKDSLAGLKTRVDKQAQFLAGEVEKANKYVSDLSSKISALSARQKELLAERTGVFATTVGDVPLADDPNARPDYNPGFSPAFAVFSFGAPHFRGMSQYGAFGRSKAGQNFKQILEAYYGNVEVRKVGMPGTIRTSAGTLAFEGRYLRGIAEMPTRWADQGGHEALKAQAVAARSYALAYVGWRVSNQNAGGSICTTEACQVYSNSKADNPGRWGDAVRETEGEILVSRASGEVVNAWYASTSGGYMDSYTSLGHATPGFWDTTSDWTRWAEGAWEVKGGSPWFYKGWYRSRSGKACGRNHPWLSMDEMADIVNAAIVVGGGGDTSGILPADANSCSGGGNGWSRERMGVEADRWGGRVTNISSISIKHGNNGQTNQVVLGTNRGEVVISGANFYRAFNLRAPGMLSLKSYLFNVERK